jgi:transcriptional regulator with XRE-family HTH domain
MTRLKLWRMQEGLTQSEAAQRLGLGESTLALLESGRMRPSSRQLKQLERSFRDAGSLFDPVRDRVEAGQ